MEEALRSAAPAAVAGAVDKLDLKTSQRLQLAAGDTGRPLLLLRPAARIGASAAATRWRVGAADGRARPFRPASRAGAGRSSSSAAATDDRGNGWWSSIMSRIVSVWLPRWPILRFLAAQARNRARHAQPVDPDAPFVLCRRGLRRAAHRRPERGGRGGRHRGRRAARRCARQSRACCRCAPPIPPPTMPRCGAWRCGRRATRPPSRPGTRRTAPTASFSMSPARRISSAAKRRCSPISPHGSTVSACRRGSLSPTRAGAAWALSRFHRAPTSRPAVRAGGRRAGAAADRGAAAVARDARDPAAARLQARRRADRQAARAVRGALREPSC